MEKLNAIGHALGRAALILAVPVLAGCATPDARIKKNPEIFSSFPPEVQANVRQGRIDIGYTHEMVYIALGEPDRKYERKTASGTTEVWSYVDTQYWTDRQRVSGRFRVRDSGGRYRTVHDSAWVDVRQEREYEKMRVEFENDQVKATEAINL